MITMQVNTSVSDHEVSQAMVNDVEFAAGVLSSYATNASPEELLLFMDDDDLSDFLSFANWLKQLHEKRKGTE